MNDCAHIDRTLVWVPVGTPGVSTRQLRYQCCDCFEYVGSSQRHALAVPSTPEVDPTTLILRDERREREREKFREEWNRWEREQFQRDAEWWQHYNEYLASDKWQKLRQLVFHRDNGICQGCYNAPATQVHHLTYKNVRSEFLWELVSICDECHARYHDKQ
jgi:5-methylcytosine-specific restriction endonuclease McrA